MLMLAADSLQLPRIAEKSGCSYSWLKQCLVYEDNVCEQMVPHVMVALGAACCFYANESGHDNMVLLLHGCGIHRSRVSFQHNCQLSVCSALTASAALLQNLLATCMHACTCLEQPRHH
eukprot:GHRR01030829.1.p1 GENE.GHRR01030829.1~~GHRR01030829.1.p1  ORF type:complete len:119 (-),score=14.02 GHRR01030829.1:554-910(-)